MDALYRFDQDVFRAIHHGWRSSALDPVFWLFSYLGLTQVQVLLTLPLLGFRMARHTVLPLIVTSLLSGLMSQVFKRVLVNRDRPSRLIDTFAAEGHLGRSFPSGHATTSFAIAMMILLITRGTRYAYLGPVAFVVATLIGISRIYRGVHWPTDVIMGALVGCFTSVLVYIALDKLGHKLHLDHPAATLTGHETLERA